MGFNTSTNDVISQNLLSPDENGLVVRSLAYCPVTFLYHNVRSTHHMMVIKSTSGEHVTPPLVNGISAKTAC